MFEKGQLIEFEITDISDRGQGIGKADGITVFVNGGVIGDVVQAEITKVKKRFCFGKVVEVKEQSKHRIEPICDYAGDCGGCVFAQTDYEAQLAVKEKHVYDSLTRIGGLTNPVVEKIEKMPEDFEFGYRNKATMPISTGGNIKRKGGIIENLDSPKIGFYRSRSHEVVDCTDCALQSPTAMAAAEATRQFMDEDNITAWDEKWQQGLMRHMIVRTAFATEEVMVTYVINGKGIPNVEKLIGMLDEAIYEVGYSLESVNISTKKDKNVAGEIYGQEIKNIAGKPVITDYIGDVKFEVSPSSFYQVNPYMTEKLYDTVREYAGLTDRENILDLYCGVGSIGLYCADKAGFILGVESVKEAVIDANRNAVINGIVNARYICGKAEEELPKLLAGEGDEQLVKAAKNADVVILDPPRAGCDERLLDAVAELAPERIVYVSCDPATLARDIKLLTEKGFKFVKAKPHDMFGWTGHIETVCLLGKRKPDTTVKIGIDMEDYRRIRDKEKAE